MHSGAGTQAVASAQCQSQCAVAVRSGSAQWPVMRGQCAVAGSAGRTEPACVRRAPCRLEVEQVEIARTHGGSSEPTTPAPHMMDVRGGRDPPHMMVDVEGGSRPPPGDGRHIFMT